MARGRHAVDIAGRRFGRWVVLYALEERSPSGGLRWRVRCDCGTEGDVSMSDLRDHGSRSCGCLRDEIHRRRMQIERGPCRQCGKTMDPRQRRQQFCSKQCVAEWNREQAQAGVRYTQPRSICSRGHVLDDLNTYVVHGVRRCRECRRAMNKARSLRLTPMVI
jgi:hypothetical protein